MKKNIRRLNNILMHHVLFLMMKKLKILLVNIEDTFRKIDNKPMFLYTQHLYLIKYIIWLQIHMEIIIYMVKMMIFNVSYN